MSVSIPNLSQTAFSQLKGTTTKLAPNGSSADYRTFTVSKPGEFNFKINNSFTNVDIVDTNTNKVVANLKSQQDAADVSARLGPGTYRAMISQANRSAGPRDYSLDVSEKQNVLMTAGGAVMSGTAQPPGNGDTGIQKHTINVVQGGSFTANFSLPNSRWAMMGKEGNVVASSDTSNPDAQADFFKKPTYKIDPGEYQLVIIPPSKLSSPTPFQFNFVPRDTTVQASGTTEESAISKIMREREVRLKQWASEAKASSTSA